MRDKYANKSPRMRFLHKYTGAIILSIFVVIVGIVWLIYDDSKYFFEDWSCLTIQDLDASELNENEVPRYNIIIAECKNEQFIP